MQVTENMLYNEKGDKVGVRLTCLDHNNNEESVNHIINNLLYYAIDKYQVNVKRYIAFCSVIVIFDEDKLESYEFGISDKVMNKE